MSASAGAGIEQLREQLSALREALEAYGDPVVAENAGLELMHKTLRERADHIEETIAKAESAAIVVSLAGVPVEHGGLPLDVAHRLLAALQEAVRGLAGAADADATALHLRGLDATDSLVSLTLTRRPGPLPAQPTDGSGHLVLDLALERLVAALGGKGDGEARAAAARVAAALEGAAVTLEVELRAPTVKGRTVTCDAEALVALRTS